MSEPRNEKSAGLNQANAAGYASGHTPDCPVQSQLRGLRLRRERLISQIKNVSEQLEKTDRAITVLENHPITYDPAFHAVIEAIKG